MCEELVNGGVLPLALGAIQGANEDMQAKGAELVAELAKVKFCCSSVYSQTGFLVFVKICTVFIVL